MGEVIDFRLPASVHADVQETYRLIVAFVQIRDGSVREKIITLAEAAVAGEPFPGSAATQGEDAADGRSPPFRERPGVDEDG